MKTGERITDREKQKRIIVRMENAYMTQNRRSTYTALEDVDYQWDLKRVQEFDRLWQEGKTFSELASYFNRDEIDVEVLARDRMLQGKIQPRNERENNMIKKAAMFTSGTDEWATPQDFYDVLDRKFHFTLDPCATHENTKCEMYFTKEDNGLLQSWQGHTVFANPPYSEPENACKKNCKKKRCVERGYHLTEYKPGVIDWMKKAYQESQNGTKVVCLVAARTDVEWWQDYAMKADHILLLRGRLKFGGLKDAAPFPSAVVIFSGEKLTTVGSPQVLGWDYRN